MWSFLEATSSSTDLALKLVHVVSLFASSFLGLFFFPFLDFDFFFVLFLCFLVFLLLLQFFRSSPCLLGILGFVEPPSVMTEFPHYCWSYYRN